MRPILLKVRYMKKIYVLIALMSVCLGAVAQDERDLFRLEAEVRIDYAQDYIAGNKTDDASGFKGRYLNVRMDGQIAKGLTYSWRQRLNKPALSSSFFDATDWATVNYKINRWDFSAGRQVVGIGGFEYDKAPIDCYFNSEYWNNIACYQFGVSASYAVGKKGDYLMFQFCESPFRRNALNAKNEELFAYNLMWIGSHDFFSSLYSLNMIEYLPGRYINYIVLGNRFCIGDFVLELDVMNRAVKADELFGKNISVMADLVWSPMESLNVFAKLTYDFNHSENIGDLCVLPGTDILRFGGGVEYFPLKSNRNLRLHLDCCYTDGKAAVAGVLRPDQTLVEAGVTWRMKLLDLKR